MTYREECWPIRKQHMQKTSVAQIRMLRSLCGKTRKNRIKNEHIQKHLWAKSKGDRLRETYLRWFEHVQYKPATMLVRKSFLCAD